MNTIALPFAITELVSGRLTYIDKLTVALSRHLSANELAELESLCGKANYRRIPYEPPVRCWLDGEQVVLPFEVTLLQPSRMSVQLLRDMKRLRTIPWGIELALDLVTANRPRAEILHEFIERHFHKRIYGRGGRVRILDLGLGRTTYIGSRGRGHQVCIYSGRPSKINNQPCCHVEWRATSRRSLAALGVETLSDVLSVDHATFWRERLRLCKLDIEALGKRVLGKHLNQAPDLRGFGRVRWNKTADYGAVYLRVHTALEQKRMTDARHLLFVEQLQLLKQLGLENLRRLVTPFDPTPLIPRTSGARHRPNRI